MKRSKSVGSHLIQRVNPHNGAITHVLKLDEPQFFQKTIASVCPSLVVVGTELCKVFTFTFEKEKDSVTKLVVWERDEYWDVAFKLKAGDTVSFECTQMSIDAVEDIKTAIIKYEVISGLVEQ